MTFKADLKARMQCHLLDQYYRCKKCCDRCSAIQPMNSRPHPMTYKNTAVDAPYAATCIDHQEYLRTAKKVFALVCCWRVSVRDYLIWHYALDLLGHCQEPCSFHPQNLETSGVSLWARREWWAVLETSRFGDETGLQRKTEPCTVISKFYWHSFPGMFLAKAFMLN